MTITSKSILAKFSALLLIGGMLAISTVTSVSKSNLPSEIANWYESLENGYAEGLKSLIADEAVIELKDLGIVQSKIEFINSLDQWKELNADATILIGEQKTTGARTNVDICYRFTSNEVLNRETFYIEAGKITKSIQERISETCTGF